MKTTFSSQPFSSSNDTHYSAATSIGARVRSMRSLLAVALLLSATSAATSSALAVPIGPVYPAPGGTTFVNTGGVSGASALATWDYSAFNAASFLDLYFGVDQITYGPLAAGLDGVLHPFSYVGAVGQTATWSLSSPYVSAGGPGDPPSGSYPVEFRMTTADFGAAPWIAAPSVGLAANIGSVIDNSAGIDFTLTWEMVADMGAGFIPINSVPQPPPGGFTVSSFGAAFYYTVPEPGTLVLAGFGLIGLLVTGRRRFR